MVARLTLTLTLNSPSELHIDGKSLNFIQLKSGLYINSGLFVREAIT
jgi:hypothetical protein